MLEPLTCLVADDIHQNRHLVRKLVERQGLRVIEARDGNETLEVFERERPDILILDIMMPDVDGLSVCRKIRETHTPVELPILFLTAKVGDEDLAAGFAAGASDYILKPVNIVTLTARLNAQIRMLRTTRALIAAEQLLARHKRMETVGLFAAGVAHNFNNILGTILGSAELLKYAVQGSSDATVDLIINAARRGADLTQSLLTFARPRQHDHCDDPAEIVNASLRLVQATTRSRIVCTIKADHDLPPLTISPGDLSSVILELLKNSVDSIADEGEISMEIEAPDGPASDELIFIVRDSGSGIGPEKVDRIFEPFYSTRNLDSNLLIPLDGKGLGLSVAYNIINQARGRIEIVETNEAGTTIRFTVPTLRSETT